MIGRLEGTIVSTGDKFVILDVNGVGYKVFCLPEVILLGAGRAGTTVFFTHLVVREDALDLYGFESCDELRLFELLIGISGIGPRSALGVLALAPVATIREAVASGETAYLTKVSGIGKKIADKIVLEMKDKLGQEFGEDGSTFSPSAQDPDCVEALIALGYTQKEAREATRDLPAEMTDTKVRLKEALKKLGRH